MTYQKRDISVEIELFNGSFSEKNSDQRILKVSNCKCQANMLSAGGITGGQMDMTLWGLSLDHMSKITTRYLSDASVYQNRIKVTVGKSTFFEGLIKWSYIDFNQLPDVPIHIEANSLAFGQVEPISETEVDGVVSAFDVAKIIASKAGMTAVNHGVTSTLNGFHAGQNAVTQFEILSNALRPDGVIVDVGYGTVDLWPSQGRRDSDRIKISRDNGLIGYPMLTGYGLQFTTIYNPAMKLLQGVTVTTDLPNASGDWVVQYNTTHSISSWIDGGPWFTHVLAVADENDS